MSIQNIAGLETDLAAAYPTRISNQRTLEKALINDVLDSFLNLAGSLKTDDYTVVIDTDSGVIFSIATDAKTFTLPGIKVGNTFTFVNAGDDGAVLLTISPNASDGIMWLGDKTDNKDLLNTKATANKGDFAVTQGMDGDVVSWNVPYAKGIWANE